MTPQEFRRAVDLGMGRAARVVLANDPTPYLDELVGACLVNGQYDGQVEDDRAPYLARLLSLAGAEERALRAILRVFPSSKSRDRSLQTGLLILLSKRGYREAEETLYAHAREDDEIADVIPNLGVSGIQWLIAHRPHLVRDDRAFEMHCWLEDAATESGQEWLDAVLDISGPLGAKIRELAASQTKPREVENAVTRRKVTLEDLLTSPLSEGGVNYAYLRGREFGRNATEDELRRAAEALLVNEEPERVLALAKAFGPRTWPLDPTLLFSKIDGEDLASRACRKLLKVRHPEVRNEALRRLSRKPAEVDTITWLSANYEAGDEQLLLLIAGKAIGDDPHRRHDIQRDLLDFAKTNLLTPTLAPDVVELLEWCVEHGPCSMCRGQAYRYLSEAGALRVEYQMEIRYDAEEETRKLSG